MAEQVEGNFNQKQKLSFHNMTLRQARNPVIQNNLKHLRFLSQKKKRAQAYYYGNIGQSPLTRSIANMVQAAKPPVHQRLGTKITLRRTPYNNTNNNVPIRNRQLQLRRNNNGNTGPPVRRYNLKKPRLAANTRLHRIRQQNAIDCGQVPQSPGLKLRRQPTIYTVQVPNDQATTTNQVFVPNHLKHTVLGSLNQELQSEIRMIQNQNQFGAQVIDELPIHVAGYGSTRLFLHDRFSTLP